MTNQSNDTNDDEAGPTDEREDGDDSTPGFGVASAAGSIGGAIYLVERRLADDGPADER